MATRTAAQSLTRRTRQCWPAYSTRSPARRVKVLFMAIFPGGEKRGLRGGGGAALLCRLGLLAGDAVAIERNLGKQIEHVRRKAELVLRQRQAALVRFHGMCQAARWSAG